MTGFEMGAIVVLFLSLLPMTALVLLIFYLITGNDAPFLKFYCLMFGVNYEKK
jgi:hypothetical protein